MSVVVTPSPAPRRVATPSWFDLRLVLGVGLVLLSVLVGARVLSSADDGVRLLAVTRDLAAGTVLSADDVETVSVRVSAADVYLPAGSDVTGRQLSRPLSRGELLSRAAVAGAPALTTITVPLAPGRAPDLSAGQRIRVWLSTKTCASQVLLDDVTVQRVAQSADATFGRGAGQDVTLSLPAARAERVVAALALPDVTLRAGVLSGPADAAATPLPLLDACAAASS